MAFSFCLLFGACVPMPEIPPVSSQIVCDEATYPADKEGVVKKHSVCRTTTGSRVKDTP
jgi:hypothetical protein